MRKEKRGAKLVLTLTVFLLLTAAAIILQIKYRGFEGPLSDNLLILILVNANFLLLAGVLFLIGRSLWKLSEERRGKVLGAKFRSKLVAAFVALSFIPTVLLFIIGSGMYTRGMERLFSLRLETALQDSVTLSQAYYERLREQALVTARQIGRLTATEGLLDAADAEAVAEFLRTRASEYGAGAVELIGKDRRALGQAVTGQFPARTFVPTPADLAARALADEEATFVSDLGRKGEIVRALAPVPAQAGGGVAAAVAVSFYVPESHARKAEGIRAGYSEYRSAFKNKNLFKLSYRLSFLAVTLALLLAAIWVALRVAASITVPIGKLAQGTVEVARGNLDYRVEERSGDEVGLLVDSFNRMTEDLKRSTVRLHQEMSSREIILSAIDAGVVSLDRGGRITTINPAAVRILDVRPEDVLGRRYDEAFGFIDLRPIRDLFRKLEEGHGRAEKELPLTVRGRTLNLRLRVSTLRDNAGMLIGSVITFDDLTELLRAKKAETWQDVARRIAHEVKNPLTPIRLNAERLRKKYAEQAQDLDQIFRESTDTIIQQVDGLKSLIDEFSKFARMPRPNLLPQRLEPVVDSVIQLYAAANRDIAFLKDIPADLPELLLDEEQLKRVFINLFKNSIEVMDRGTVSVTARAADGAVRVEVTDDGPGVSDEDLPRIFEPYFSRKKKGGGLGLAIVERIIAEHNGSIHAEQVRPHGARFIMELPARK